LALSDDGRHYRVREEVVESRLEDDVLYSRWQPWPDVEVETWLTPLLPWQIRVHRVKNARPLYSAESGFAVALPPEVSFGSPVGLSKGENFAVADYPTSLSGVSNLLPGPRRGELTFPHPNSNLVAPRTSLPALLAELEPGEHWLGVAVLGLPASPDNAATWQKRPELIAGQPGRYILRLSDISRELTLK
jgi:hypothetical protein